MPKRDYFAEIEARRSRLRKRGSRWDQVDARIGDLTDIVKFVEGSTKRSVSYRAELAKYVAIGFIACVEGYFRLAVKDLIDAGGSFQARVPALKDVRITLDHVVEIHRRRASLGEFVSHSISLSNLEEINEALGTLMSTDFLDSLKNVPLDLDEKPKSLVQMGFADTVMKDVKYSFEHRHVFAHELAPRFQVDVRAICAASRAIIIFLYAADTLVANVISDAAV